MMKSDNWSRCAIALLGWVLAMGWPGPAQEDGEQPLKIKPLECLMIERLGRSRRSAVHTDALEARIVAGEWKPPEAGHRVKRPDGSEAVWRSVKAGKGGAFNTSGFSGGYAYFRVDMEADEIMLLEAAGHSQAWVNGEIRAGDPYGYGWHVWPVELREGKNDLLFRLGRRPLRVELRLAEKSLFFHPRDRTLPHAIAGKPIDDWAAVIVVNATPEPARGVWISASVADGEAEWKALPIVPPLGFRKIPFRIKGPAPGADQKTVPVTLRLARRGKRGHGAGLDLTRIELGVRRPEQTHVRTFVSDIDGSVQYFAVRPARSEAGSDGGAKALVLSLHGAAVQAMNQVNAYGPKDWCHIVAPTNRRPYGFDWEDWGRLDALEVLERAVRELGADSRRVYLTGHSMGGHGAWHLGVTYPDRFAVVGPSAGWVSFWSYGGARRFQPGAGPEAMLRRAASPSRTLALIRNLAPRPVYVLHGEKDDNVPVGQARRMKEALERFHEHLAYHEQPGVGHWWDASKEEPGASCVDWPPLFDLFRRSRLPAAEAVSEIDFTTASPGVSSRFAWLTVEMQAKPLVISRVRVRYEANGSRLRGVTENVRRLSLDATRFAPAKTLAIELDETKLDAVPLPQGTANRLWLERAEGRWTVGRPPPPAWKGPKRYGPFKAAFRNRMVFVYATDGNEEENAWALARARFDAETFAYRGNGSPEVLADVAFDPAQEPDRNVILYGNADCHTLWEDLLGGESPVQVKRGELRIGSRVVKEDDLACLFVRPRRGSAKSLIGVVSGTGLQGFRLTDRLPYFVSGVAYPDVTVIGPEMLEKGAVGVRAAGFFGEDWSVEQGEIAWR